MQKVNVFDCQLDAHYKRGTIAHRAARLGPRLGARKIGAGAYKVDAGQWVWPYHYHHGVEEWLYIVAGSPVLRDPGGERTLTTGDLTCFPAGPSGAHTVGGPGRFVIFSAGGWPEPSVSVYPDSDKVGPRPGDTGAGGLDNLDFRRRDAVDYWYGEGSDDPVQPPELVRAPAAGSVPVANVMTIEALEPPLHDVPAGFRRRIARIGPRLGSERLGATLCELDPGQGTAPYHCEHGREEWLLVLSGSPTLRHPEGEDRLTRGDLVCFPDGPTGARRLLNGGNEIARAVFFSTQEIPSVREYLDRRKMMVRYSGDHDAAVFSLSEPEDFAYWEGGLV